MIQPALRKSLNVVLPLLVIALIAENIILLQHNDRLKTELPLPSVSDLHRRVPQ